MISLAHSPRVDRAPIAAGLASRLAAAIPFAGAVILAAVAPFEVPLVAIGALTLTSVEAVAVCTLVAAAAAIVYGAQPLVWRTAITAPIAACIAVAVAAAIFSPIDSGNALRFAGRMAAAGAMFLLVLNAATTNERRRAFVSALVAVGTVLSVIALLEVAQVAAVLQALKTFRPGFHVVGGQLRATSTLLYPTIASMYLEVVFCLGLWLVIDDARRPSRLRSAMVLAALATISAGVVATFTRAGLISVALALVLAFTAQLVKSRRFEAAHAKLLVLSVIFVVLLVVSRSSDVLLARLWTEGTRGWYGVTYKVPATLSLETHAEYQVPITLANTGRVVWDSSGAPPFAMSYHWLREDTDALQVFNGWRTAFPGPVAPGESITMPVNVKAPAQPGRYVLVWDVVHEQRAWLSTEGVMPGRTTVTVAPGSEPGTRGDAESSPLRALPSAKVRPGRLTLWQAALRIAADYPLLGVGPDNYRRVYGAYVGDVRWDTRVHANNMYLEVLAGAGILGFAALLWLVSASGYALWRRWRAAPAPAAPALAAFCATWLAIVTTDWWTAF